MERIPHRKRDTEPGSRFNDMRRAQNDSLPQGFPSFFGPFPSLTSQDCNPPCDRAPSLAVWCDGNPPAK